MLLSWVTMTITSCVVRAIGSFVQRVRVINAGLPQLSRVAGTPQIVESGSQVH